MTLSIPDNHKELLQKYSQLPQESREEILTYLRGQEVFELSIENLAQSLTESYPSLNINFDRLIEVFFSINRSLSKYKKGKESFVPLIIESLEKSNVKLDSDIKEDLLIVLNSSISIKSKSIELFSENENILTDVRILTDIRPIFSDDEFKINYVFTQHTLKLEYNDSEGNENTFFITLKPSDLNVLKEQIARAEKKQLAIGQNLGDSLKLIDLNFSN